MKIDFINDWLLNIGGYEQLKCTLPASVYSVLYDDQKIEHPHITLEHQQLLDLSKLDCLFSAAFNISAEQMKASGLILKLEGLDTVCDIKINGKQMLHTENLFREFEIDLKNVAKVGQNSLDIYIHSPLKYIEEKQRKNYVWAQTDEVNGTSVTIDGIGQIQKPSFMFGWDWAPQLPDMGIYGQICVCAYENRITEVDIKQSVANKRATILITAEAEREGDIFYAELKSPSGKVIGVTEFTDIAQLYIDDPQLWWPNNLGDQSLYQIEVQLRHGTAVLDEVSKSVGIRTLTISREKDTYGKEFCFCVNGKKIFAMGANYVPFATPAPWMTDNKLKSLLSDCVAANYNCVRIWGGGYYASDLFYDLCDKLGLIVWQDFMFACRNVCMSDDFIRNVSSEVKDNLLRIRHHTSLGLMCGNNEMEQCVFNNGHIGTPGAVKDYLEFYDHLLPNLVAQYAPNTFYWPSSPSSGTSGYQTFSENDGDFHFWGTWHAGEPFEVYRKHFFRFCSEYGFESFPSQKTISAFCPKQEQNPFSCTMDYHQRFKGGNAKILAYISDKFRYPENFGDLIYASQIIQGEAIKYGVEHFRRNRDCCKGSLYWQLNDCWPAVSWSSIDYFGRWKALHYMAKRFYSTVLLSACDTENQIVFSVSNERLTTFKGEAEFFISTSKFEVLESHRIDVKVNSLAALEVFALNIEKYDKKKVFAGYRLLVDGKRVSDAAVLLVNPKHFGFVKPQIKCTLEGQGKNYVLSLTSDVFTKYVQVDCETADLRLSDNFFDMTDNKPKVILITADKDIDRDELYAKLIIKTAQDIT